MEQLKNNSDANILQDKDICKVFDFFHYKVGTSLDCAKETGVLRNSVTWYIQMLEDEGILQAICRKRDSTTGYPAKHYSADKRLWKSIPKKDLNLLRKE
jgi:predicted ArsR family transcriptional regulator